MEKQRLLWLPVGCHPGVVALPPVVVVVVVAVGLVVAHQLKNTSSHRHQSIYRQDIYITLKSVIKRRPHNTIGDVSIKLLITFPFDNVSFTNMRCQITSTCFQLDRYLLILLVVLF